MEHGSQAAACGDASLSASPDLGRRSRLETRATYLENTGPDPRASFDSKNDIWAGEYTSTEYFLRIVHQQYISRNDACH